MKLKQFLLNNKTKYSSNEQQLVQYILGNESADLDSIFGSLFLAYYKTLTSQKNEKIFIPIINTNQQNLDIRFEAVYLLEYLGIDRKLLFYKDNIDSNYDFELVLYDHNKLANGQSQHFQKVVEIVDHHEDQEFEYQHIQSKQIEKIGSACSLVSEKILSLEQNMIDPQIKEILSLIIRVDCFDFDLKMYQQRWIDKDLEIYKQLGYQASQQQQMYGYLNQIKYDVQMNMNLTLDSLLFKDSKVFEYKFQNDIQLRQYLYSVICLDYFIFLQKAENSIDILVSELSKYSFDGNFLLFVYPKDDFFIRQILIFNKNKKIHNSIRCNIESKLELKILDQKDYFITYQDPTSTYSRKILEPIIRSTIVE